MVEILVEKGVPFKEATDAHATTKFPVIELVNTSNFKYPAASINPI
jgi:hypothetical protein